VADREDGTLTEFYERGSDVPEGAWIELMGAASRLFERGRTVTISGSMPRGMAPDGYRRLVSEARTAGMRVALDAAGDPLRLALDAQPEIVKVNADEAAAVLGAATGDRDGAAAAAAGLRELGGGAGRFGIVTRGTDGVIVAAADGTMWEGLATERGRYPVGSGDAFLAGFVVGLEREARWPDPLRLALGAAAANAEVPGAGVIDPARARVLASRTAIREI
jgi:fructose-1-phosphate kinase PfkB-like protein